MRARIYAFCAPVDVSFLIMTKPTSGQRLAGHAEHICGQAHNKQQGFSTHTDTQLTPLLAYIYCAGLLLQSQMSQQVASRLCSIYGALLTMFCSKCSAFEERGVFIYTG
jgi:hypothetical protein